MCCSMELVNLGNETGELCLGEEVLSDGWITLQLPKKIRWFDSIWVLQYTYTGVGNCPILGILDITL